MDTNTNGTQANDNNLSNLWDYMTKQENQKAKCNKCNKILSRQNGATSGLRKHLFHVHKVQSFGIISENSRSKSSEISTEDKEKLDSILINCIAQDGRGFDDMRRPGMLKVFNHLAPGYVPPHRNTVQRRLKRLQSHHKSILINRLSKVPSIAVTCDFWSDKRLFSYMCLTGHFRKGNKLVSKVLSFSWFHHRHTSKNISMIIKKELKELNILEKTRSITTDGAANMQKIGVSLPNNSKQIWCIGHRFHLVVCNGLGLWVGNKPTSLSSTNTLTTTSSSTTNTDANDADSDEEDYTDDVQFIPHSSPLHNLSNPNELLDQSSDNSNGLHNNSDSNSILNKNFVDEESGDCLTDITDNWSIGVVEEFDPITGEMIQQDIGVLMKKCRSMVKLMHKSSILMNYVVNLKEEFGISVSLQLDCKSRWSSTQFLIEVMLDYKKIINKINSEKYDIGLNKKQTSKLSVIELDQFDWKILDILNIILKPFVDATNMISGSQYPTIGIAYFAIVQIREFLEDQNNTVLNDRHDINILMQLKQLLLIQINKYFMEKDEQWEILKNYAYFDPIGYGCLTRRERRSIESNIMDLYERYVAQEGDEEIDETQSTSTSNKKQSSKQTSTSSMASFLTSIGKKNLPSSSTIIRSTTKSKFNEELASYRLLAQKEYNSIIYDDKENNVMEFWQHNQSELKCLSQIAYDHLITPATSVPSESAFSTASYLLRKQRSRLTPNNLCYSMFLKDKIDDNNDELDN